MARRPTLDLTPVLWILALIIAAIVICDVAEAINSGPAAPNQRGGIIGRVFRWVLYQTVFGEGDTPAPMRAECHAPPQLAQPKAGDVVGDKNRIDHAEGW